MATGIQTGMNRGSRSGISRNSQLGKGAPGGGGGPLGKLSEIWGNLGKATKIGISVLAVLVVLGGVGGFLYSNSTAYVKLYPAKLSDEDIKEISTALTAMQIPHNIDLVEGIMLPPDKRIPAQVKLAEMSLPRKPVLTEDKVEGGMGKTAEERKATRQQLLEGDITLALREMEGINDAMVKLAVPDKTFFQDDSKRVTARVFLNLKNGYEPSREQIAGMLALVSASVPELEAKNVQIIDQKGVNLSAKVPQEGNGYVASGTQLEIQAAEEARLQEKAQQALDQAVPGKTKVSVNLEMDFSKREEERFTPGSASDEGVVMESRQITREVLNKGDKGGDSVGEQLSTGGKKPKEGSDYVNEKEASNYMIQQHKTKVVDTGFRVKRITASVLADNLSDDEKAAIAGSVAKAIGIDESRGDEVSVDNIAFQRNLNDTASNPFAAGASQAAEPAATGVSGQHLATAMAVGAAMVLGLIGMFLFKQHKVHEGQGTIIATNPSGLTTTSITDHFTEKSGKTTGPTSTAGATQVNTTEELEKLVKERPTKVAEMLKSTWLSQS